MIDDIANFVYDVEIEKSFLTDFFSQKFHKVIFELLNNNILILMLLNNMF